MGDVDVRSERLREIAKRIVVRERDRDLLRIIKTRDKVEAAFVWKKFRREYLTVDALDLGQMKLMARVILKLKEFAIDEPDIERLSGIARFLWVRSKVSRRRALDVAADLRKRGVTSVCALKGLALTLGHGIHAEDHPIWDADLLPGNFDETAKRLRELGFKEGASDPHAMTFVKEHAIIDLHRYPVVQDPHLNFFEGASDVDGVLVPTATHCFLHALLHGVYSDALWLFDAEKIVEHVDLDSIAHYARHRRLRGILGAALSRLDSGRSFGEELLTEVTEHEYLELVAYASRGRRGSHHWIHAARKAERQIREARTASRASGNGIGVLPRAGVEERWVREWETL